MRGLEGNTEGKVKTRKRCEGARMPYGEEASGAIIQLLHAAGFRLPAPPKILVKSPRKAVCQRCGGESCNLFCRECLKRLSLRNANGRMRYVAAECQPGKSERPMAVKPRGAKRPSVYWPKDQSPAWENMIRCIEDG